MPLNLNKAREMVIEDRYPLPVYVPRGSSGKLTQRLDTRKG